MKKNLLAGLALSALLFGTSAAAQNPITIATDATFPPFESIDAQGQLVGYDVELMQAICDEMQLDCNIINAAWDGMIPGLVSRKYDALISQLTVTDARRRIMAFSDIYSHPVFRFVGRQGEEYDFGPDGLKGKVVAVQTGTPMDAYVTKYHPEATIKRYDAGSAAYLELTGGRADLHMSYEAQIIHSFLKTPQGEGYALVGPRLSGQDAPEFGEGVAIALNKRSTELLASINEGLARLRANGKLDALDAKYFSAD